MPRIRKDQTKHQNEEEGRHLENIERTAEATANTQKTRGNAKIGVSYRKPTRDYSKCIKWTGAMNKELYLMYLRSKPEEKGYQKRLKSIWDENYEECKHLTPRHIAEQVKHRKEKSFEQNQRELIEIQFKVSGELVTSGEPVQPGEYNIPREYETQVEQEASENNNVPGVRNILEEHES